MRPSSHNVGKREGGGGWEDTKRGKERKGCGAVTRARNIPKHAARLPWENAARSTATDEGGPA